MTLTHGRFISYEYDRMVVLFSMLDGNREIPCAVSTSAMDELDGVVRARAGQREGQFMQLRERIEACAADKHRATEFERPYRAPAAQQEGAHEFDHLSIAFSAKVRAPLGF